MTKKMMTAINQNINKSLPKEFLKEKQKKFKEKRTVLNKIIEEFKLSTSLEFNNTSILHYFNSLQPTEIALLEKIKKILLSQRHIIVVCLKKLKEDTLYSPELFEQQKLEKFKKWINEMKAYLKDFQNFMKIFEFQSRLKDVDYKENSLQIYIYNIPKNDEKDGNDIKNNEEAKAEEEKAEEYEVKEISLKENNKNSFEEIICKYYGRPSGCKYGENCRYKHISNNKLFEKKDGICSKFLQGICFNSNENCKYLHAEPKCVTPSCNSSFNGINRKDYTTWIVKNQKVYCHYCINSQNWRENRITYFNNDIGKHMGEIEKEIFFRSRLDNFKELICDNEKCHQPLKKYLNKNQEKMVKCEHCKYYVEVTDFVKYRLYIKTEREK